MMTISVADVIDNTLAESGWGSFCIYIFRDGNFVLYVGKSEQNIIDRLEDHLGLSYRPESQIGKLVQDNAPKSYKWNIDLLTLDDCRSVVSKHFPTVKVIDILTAERSVISEYCPALNRQSNADARSLPRKYTRPKDLRTQAAYKKVFDDKK